MPNWPAPNPVMHKARVDGAERESLLYFSPITRIFIMLYTFPVKYTVVVFHTLSRCYNHFIPIIVGGEEEKRSAH